MRKIILAFLFMLVSALGAFAQSTTVSGTVTDASSQAWANGTYSFTFQPNPQFPAGPYTWSGGTLNNVISGTLDSSGAYSVSIPSSSAITPAGSTWILQVTPDATSLSFSTARTTVTGGTQTLNATPPAILISWSLPPGPAISAYTDAEIGGSLPKGAEYFNTTSNLTRVWNGSAWANQGTGGGGGTCPGGANGDIQFKSGSNCVNAAALSANAFANIDGSGNISLAYNNENVTVGPGTVSLQATDSGATIPIEANGNVSISSDAANVTVNGHANLILNSSAGTVSESSATTFTQTVADAAPVTPGSVTQRVVTGTTDTILNTDRTNRVAYNSATAVAVSLPTAGSTGFAGGFNTRISNQNTGTVTITPATGTINGNATLVLLEGQFCFVSPSSAGTSYAADCGESQMTAGANVALTRGVHSLTVAVTGLATAPQNTPAVANQFVTAYNSTTGAFTQSLIGASATGPNAFVTATGATNAYVVTLSPAATALTAGLRFQFIPNAANTTTTPTVNVSGLGAVTIKRYGGQALVANDIIVAMPADVLYDGTAFELMDPQTGNIPFSLVTAANITASAGNIQGRVMTNDGGVCTNGELALSAGWGSTAAASGVVGLNQTCEWTITSAGTGQAANPTVTDTLINAFPAATAVCSMQMVGGTGLSTLIDQTTLSATAPVFTFGGTPVATSTYKVVRRCGP